MFDVSVCGQPSYVRVLLARDSTSISYQIASYSPFVQSVY